jgi:hypothetical protein
MRGLLNDFLKIYRVSALLALVPSILSVILGAVTLDASDSIWWKVVFWNFSLAATLNRGGQLPDCPDCGLFTLIVPVLYFIFIGVLGYACIIAPLYAYFRLNKKDKLP